MLRSGREYLNGLKDGRVIYVGAERITDVVSHPGFRAAAETIAGIFDLKSHSVLRNDMIVEEGEGSPYSTYFLMPRTREDLEKRLRCHQHIADATYGLFGRSPDHVASLVTGLAMQPEVLDQAGNNTFSRNLLEYYRSARARDSYAVYAVLPNRPAFRGSICDETECQGLRITREDDDGVVLHGVKALATAAMFADEVWIGNLQPIRGNQESEAITCVVPCNASGLQLWSRKVYASSATNEFDSPLTWRFDEGDAVLVFNNVKVDWSSIFVHRDPTRSSEIYVQTPAHCLANHQAAVRSCAKVRLLVGLAHRLAGVTGAGQVPAVRDVLGRLAALEASLAAIVDAQVFRFEQWPAGKVSPNQRYVYAALNWCQEFFPVVIEALRELCGSGVFRFPANTEVIDVPELRTTVEDFWGARQDDVLGEMQLFKIAWDLVGSEFAGRQQHYERFYAGPPYIVRGHNYREASWNALDTIVARLLTRCPFPSILEPDQNSTSNADSGIGSI
jgi:4-hydroxyphenylacetate 3-monooxygenase